ncbi:hypothetical protein ACLB2K_021045 [Fragaria x ananassa]
MSALEHWDVLDGTVARETTPEDLSCNDRKKLMGDSSAAYWTTLAPNVEDYSGRLKWGNEFLKRRMGPCSSSEISPETLKRIRRYIFDCSEFVFATKLCFVVVTSEGKEVDQDVGENGLWNPFRGY